MIRESPDIYEWNRAEQARFFRIRWISSSSSSIKSGRISTSEILDLPSKDRCASRVNDTSHLIRWLTCFFIAQFVEDSNFLNENRWHYTIFRASDRLKISIGMLRIFEYCSLNLLSVNTPELGEKQLLVSSMYIDLEWEHWWATFYSFSVVSKMMSDRSTW